MKSKKCIAWVVYSILLVVIAVVLVLVVRDNGIYPSGDDTFYHIYRGEYVYKSIKSGDFFPKLDKNWYNGVELMRFWPPMCAYVMAFLFYNIGGLITGDVAFGVGPVIGILLIGCLIFLLFRKGYQPESGVKNLTAVKANN